MRTDLWDCEKILTVPFTCIADQLSGHKWLASDLVRSFRNWIKWAAHASRSRSPEVDARCRAVCSLQRAFSRRLRPCRGGLRRGRAMATRMVGLQFLQSFYPTHVESPFNQVRQA